MALIKCPECKKQISDSVYNCPNCGYRFSDGEKEKIIEKEKKTKIAGFFLLAIIAFVIFKVCSSGGTESTTSWENEDHSAAAWVFTQTYVENNLKSPSTAKFPWGYSDYVQRNGTTYTINSYVDSQNSFGAMIRTKFSATVQETSKDNFKMISFQFYE